MRRSALLLLLLSGLLAACSSADTVETPTEEPDPVIDPVPDPTPDPDPASWQPLFSGSDLSAWQTWLESEGADSDPQGIFRLEDGVLHILGVDSAVSGQGYLKSRATYSTFRLRFEYMWGERRFNTTDAPRGGGLLYLANGPDKIWPRSLEFQIQEGDTGDLWLIDQTSVDTTITPGSNPVQFQPDGQAYTTTAAPYTRLKKSMTTDTPTGWNTVELIVGEDAIEHRVNGTLVNRVANPQYGGAALTSGHLVFQAQNSEIMLRNLEIMTP